jgi:hypothetical protein
MPYQEVKTYANVYELQDEYVRLAERTIDAGVAAMAWFAHDQDLTKLQDSQLALVKQTVLASMSDLRARHRLRSAKSCTSVIHKFWANRGNGLW